MLNRLLAATALAAPLLFNTVPGALAQGTTATPPSATTVPREHLRNDQVRASKLIGTTVYDIRNAKIGDVNEVVIDPDGKVAAVVLGVGGFLGMGEKNVAVPMSELRRGDDNRVVVDRTKDQLQQAANFDLTYSDNRGSGSSGTTRGSNGTGATGGTTA